MHLNIESKFSLLCLEKQSLANIRLMLRTEPRRGLQEIFCMYIFSRQLTRILTSFRKQALQIIN